MCVYQHTRAHMLSLSHTHTINGQDGAKASDPPRDNIESAVTCKHTRKRTHTHSLSLSILVCLCLSHTHQRGAKRCKSKWFTRSKKETDYVKRDLFIWKETYTRDLKCEKRPIKKTQCKSNAQARDSPLNIIKFVVTHTHLLSLSLSLTHTFFLCLTHRHQKGSKWC